MLLKSLYDLKGHGEHIDWRTDKHVFSIFHLVFAGDNYCMGQLCSTNCNVVYLFKSISS